MTTPTAMTASTPPVAPVASTNANALRVLVVDDSAPVRLMLKAKLEEIAGNSAMTVAVDVAVDGWQALEMVQKAAYDVIFLDVNMPDMDGFEACRRIKQLQPTRIAMLSAMTSHTDHEEGHRAGCDNYITKPPHDADIKAILRLVSLKKLTAC